MCIQETCLLSSLPSIQHHWALCTCRGETSTYPAPLTREASTCSFPGPSQRPRSQPAELPLAKHPSNIWVTKVSQHSQQPKCSYTDCSWWMPHSTKHLWMHLHTSAGRHRRATRCGPSTPQLPVPLASPQTAPPKDTFVPQPQGTLGVVAPSHPEPSHLASHQAGTDTTFIK